MKIYIAADHQGVGMKNEIIEFLKEKKYDINEIGIENHENDNYPDFAFKLGKLVIENKGLGILICGNGIGMSIAANKVTGIRAARVLDTDDAFKCKNHNGANVISLSSKIDINLTKDIVLTFINTENVSNPKYVARVNQMDNYRG